jgi:hypothetical protein
MALGTDDEVSLRLSELNINKTQFNLLASLPVDEIKVHTEFGRGQEGHRRAALGNCTDAMAAAGQPPCGSREL